MAWVVVNACNYDGLDVCGPFESEAVADSVAQARGGRARRVIQGGDSGQFVAVEACVLGGITVYGWFATLQAAEAFCYRAAKPGARTVAAAVGWTIP